MKWSIISFALLVLASCSHKQEALDPTLESFFSENAGDVRKPEQFVDVMTASGARADATLSKHHFDGRRLNSLGEDKLARMLKDDAAAEPMRIFLNLDEKDAASTARQSAVVAFLKDAGLADAQVDVVYGQNPDNWSRASTHLAALPKTDTGTGDSASAAKGTDASSGSDKAAGTSTGSGANGLTGADGNLFK